MPVNELQAAVPQVQSTELSEEPSPFVQELPLEHVLVEESQIKPVGASQTLLPHLQGENALNVDASVDVHEATGAALQKFPAAKQYLPLKELHLAVPHKQSTELSVEPSGWEQEPPLEQVLVEEVQKRPEIGVQNPDAPHKQLAGFDVAPLVCMQSGAVTHRQKS
jgi:hypothetical protein